MKYQLIKHLKTKSKVLVLEDTFTDALNAVPAPAKFVELSYIGNFPVFQDHKNTYSIQGFADIGVVCSLPEKDLLGYK